MDRLHYMVYENKTIVNGYRPTIGDVVSVRTFVGKGITGQEIGEEKDGYRLKYPSADGLLALYKTVPHYWCFERVKKTLPQIAATKFWNSGLLVTSHGIVFQCWAELPTFISSWGELGLCELLLIAHPTVGADNNFAPRVKLLRDKKLVERLASKAEFSPIREAAARILAKR